MARGQERRLTAHPVLGAPSPPHVLPYCWKRCFVVTVKTSGCVLAAQTLKLIHWLLPSSHHLPPLQTSAASPLSGRLPPLPLLTSACLSVAGLACSRRPPARSPATRWCAWASLWPASGLFTFPLQFLCDALARYTFLFSGHVLKIKFTISWLSLQKASQANKHSGSGHLFVPSWLL